MNHPLPGRSNEELNADDAHYDELGRKNDAAEHFVVRFFVLAGKFGVQKTEAFATMAEAEAAVVAHATAGGFSNVKCIDDGEMCHVRWTAKTPNGRSGRNVADCDLPSTYEDSL